MRMVDYVPSYASHLRQNGFTDQLRRKGKDVISFPINPNRPDGGYEEIKALAEWLRTLPRPIAAMAAFDQRAAHLLEAAQRCGVKVTPPPPLTALVPSRQDSLQGVHTPWLRGYIPLGFGGVYPLASGVYTPSPWGCIPLGLGGIYP